MALHQLQQAFAAGTEAADGNGRQAVIDIMPTVVSETSGFLFKRAEIVSDAVSNAIGVGAGFKTQYWGIGLLISYHIVAYLFGWDMLTIGGLQIKRGEHDVIRAIMFLIFIGFWLWGFFSF